ncbi:MAG: DNA translocase FtsK 4TM domain-containing protein, partial [bacterium]
MPVRAARAGFVAMAWEAAMDFTQERRQELSGLLQLIAGVSLGLALFPKNPDLLGLVGGYLFRFCFGLLGVAFALLPASLILLGLSNLGRRRLRAASVRAAGWALIAVSVCCLVNLFLPNKIASGPAVGLYLGGLLGRLLGTAMIQYCSTAGTVILCLALAAVAVYLLEQETVVKMALLRTYERIKVGGGFKGSFTADSEEVEVPALERGRGRKAKASAAMETEAADGIDEAADNGSTGLVASAAPRVASAKEREQMAERFVRERGSKIKVSEAGPRVNTLASTETLGVALEQGTVSGFKDYKLPSPSLLQPASGSISAPKDYEEVSANLERVLASFGVAAKVVEVCPGPTVTRYEIALSPGVKMSRVVSLADDIALGAKASAVRIEGPIPGKGTLGVEIPNTKAVAVMMRELVETAEFRESAHKLIFALGKDIGGSMIFSNLAEMPHLMVAGSTGSGKSVCLNSIITSILFRAAPDEVKLLM